MTKQSALSRLLTGLKQGAHDFRPTLQIFQDLNVDRIADDMRLVEKGEERGRRNEPPSSSVAFDDVEHLIIERVDSEKRAAHSLYLNHIHTYAERLTGLDFESQFNTIRQAAPEAVSDFRAEVSQGQDELYRLHRHVREIEDNRASFRSRHKLDRPAHVSSNAKRILGIGVILILFVVEVAMNAGFLGISNEFGYVGAAVQAVSFAALNILASFFIGLRGIRQLNHRSLFRKFVGLLSLMFYLGFAVALNLSLAHYREVSASALVDAGLLVIERLWHSPLVLADFNSWIFFAIGIVFSLASLADGIQFRDPYPGYEELEKRVQHAHEDYSSRKEELIARLQDIRDDASEAMKDASRYLSLQRGEYDAILQARSRLDSSFVSHQAHLERTAQSLLSIYHETNRRTRASPEPQHFSRSYNLERIEIERESGKVLARDDLRNAIAKTQDVLQAQTEEIYREFDDAVRKYGQIGKLNSEASDGTR